MEAPKPSLVNDDVRFRTCGCGCHAVHHFANRLCRYYEECGCEGFVVELVGPGPDPATYFSGAVAA